MTFIPRQIVSTIEKLIRQYPIIALTGPRQSGKTTLLQQLFPDYTYLTLENTDVRDFAQNDPIGFFNRYPNRIILDEVQQVPELFSFLQTKVDARASEMGQFILSGSQNFHLMERITQTLAGRVALCKLLPLDIQEMKLAGILPDAYRPLLRTGFYPAVYSRALDPAVFYHNYLQTYVERDVSSLLKVQNMNAFRLFIRLCAGRIGQILNFSNLANECGISQPTARAWLSILESSYILFLVQPYYENFSKRLVKSPKLYFYDTGLAAYLLNVLSEEDVDLGTQGILFENMVIADFYKQNEHRYALRHFWYWRDSNGLEIDLMEQKGKSLRGWEIKSGMTVSSSALKNLEQLAQLVGNRMQKSTLIYGGNDSHERTHFDVRSWREVWS